MVDYSSLEYDWTQASWVLPFPLELNLLVDEYAPNKWISLLQKIKLNENYRKKRLILQIKAYNFLKKLRNRMLIGT